MLVIQPRLCLVQQNPLHEAVRLEPLGKPGLGLVQQSEIKRSLFLPDRLCANFPTSEELRNILEQGKGIYWWRCSRLQYGNELFLGMVKSLDLWGFESWATLPKHRPEDDGRRITPDVVVVPSWVLKELLYCPRRFRILNGKHPIHNLHIQNCLNVPSK